MFRNNQLLRRSKDLARQETADDSRPVAILADENEVEASILTPILERYGFRVLETREGAAALDLAMRHSPRLVVATMDTPRISGSQIHQKIREQRGMERVPFILITPQGVLPDKLVGYETFASDYAQRPLNLQEFEIRLTGVLRREQQQRLNLHVQPPPPQPTTFMPSTPIHPVEPVRPPLEVVPQVPTDRTPGQASAYEEFVAPRGRETRPPPSHPPPPPPAPPKAPSEPERLIGQHFGSTPRVDTREIGWESLPGGTEMIESILTREYLVQRGVDTQVAVLYKDAFSFLSNCNGRVDSNNALDLSFGTEVAKRIVGSLRHTRQLLLLATDRTSEFSFRQHSINVGIIASRIAQTLEWPEVRVARVCLAGIVHDIGTLRLPRKLIGKYSGFTNAERVEMQKRPVYSAELVSGVGGFEWLPQMVLQVYERENGTGYPNGLSSKELVDEARVLGVSDVFEACIHRRPQRPAMTGYQALEVLTSSSDAYSDRITKAMIRSFSVYPFNEFVVLNTGEVGKVVDINTDNPLRPIVQLLFSADGEEFRQDKITDLSRNSQLWITSAITADDLPRRM